MDEIERAVIRDEGYDPDDPRVHAALQRVRNTLRRHPTRHDRDCYLASDHYRTAASDAERPSN